jgi:hypothetical protein
MRAYHTNKPQRRKTTHYFLPGPPRPQCAGQGPGVRQAEVKAAYWQIFDDIAASPGQAAVDEALRRADAFAARYQHVYPAAVACLTSTLDELTVHLRFPLLLCQAAA